MSGAIMIAALAQGALATAIVLAAKRREPRRVRIDDADRRSTD